MALGATPNAAEAVGVNRVCKCTDQSPEIHHPEVAFGAHLRYWVRNRDRELACLLWTSPAWKMKPRDAWIGWSEERRPRNLPWIVNHGRFLILPWVRVKGLASKILAHCARQLPENWERFYGSPSAAAGNAGGRAALSRNLLPRCQLDLSGPDHRSG